MPHKPKTKPQTQKSIDDTCQGNEDLMLNIFEAPWRGEPVPIEVVGESGDKLNFRVTEDLRTYNWKTNKDEGVVVHKGEILDFRKSSLELLRKGASRVLTPVYDDKGNQWCFFEVAPKSYYDR